MINCTVASNTCDASDGAGVWWQLRDPDPSDFAVANSILWNNAANGILEEKTQLRLGLPLGSVQACDIMFASEYKTGSNTDVDLAGGDVRLQEASPVRELAIVGLGDDDLDADEDGCTTEVTPDADLLTRDYFGPDMGAYEYRCLGDVTDHIDSGPDGDVNVFDLILLLTNWAVPQSGCMPGSVIYPGEIAEPYDMVDIFDLTALLQVWGPCGEPLGFIPEDEQDCFDEYGLDEENRDELIACLEAVAKMQQQ